MNNEKYKDEDIIGMIDTNNEVKHMLGYSVSTSETYKYMLATIEKEEGLNKLIIYELVLDENKINKITTKDLGEDVVSIDMNNQYIVIG